MAKEIIKITKSLVILLGLIPALQNVGHAAGFTPVAISPASFNYDLVVEATAPFSLNDVVNATMDGGTNRSGFTWFERGYMGLISTNGLPFTNGLPPATSLVTNITGGGAVTSVWQMPPTYHTNNCIMVGHHNGGRTPVTGSGTLTFSTPRAADHISFLTASGGGPVNVGYTIHYADNSTEIGTPFAALDWFNGAVAAVNCAGRVNVGGGGLGNIDATTACRLFEVDVAPANASVNISNIDFYYISSGGTPNTNNSGRAVVFAVSGSSDSGANYSPIAVTGYNYDMVVEADGPQTTGGAAPTCTNQVSGNISNSVTATMDGGISKSGNVWFEKGYYRAFPDIGLPAAGSSVTSQTLPATYTMPSSYAANNAVLLSRDITNGANITFSGSYGALSFLCAAANGDTFLPAILQHLDGTSETNAIFVPDWFNTVLPVSYLGFGRVTPNNRSINSSRERFTSPFSAPGSLPFGQANPGYDFRGLGLPAVRLFDAVINVANTGSPITNISLSFTNGTGSTRVAGIFAVSGAAVGNVPPVFGSQGTTTPGQPNGQAGTGIARAVLNDVARIKNNEGNNVVVSVTNIAGTGPISYQWQKAPRGGGLHDIFYSIDYGTFANVVNDGRISGATSSALVIGNANIGDTADYLCVASNPYGSITSFVATVNVLSSNASVLVGQPAGDIITAFAADSTPVAESLDHVIDQAAQKWLSDGIQFGGACCSGPLPFVGPVGFVVKPVSGASFVNALRFFTANDSTGRDPYDYGLEGSIDGSSWTFITGGALKGTLSLPTGRNGTGTTPVDPLNQNVVEVNFANPNSYSYYRVTVTNNYNGRGDALMQVAEIQLIGTFVPAPPSWVRQPGDPDVANVTVFVGASPVFAAKATGVGALAPKYQWYKSLSTLISGATSSSYTFPNAQLSDSGTTFYCTASNSSSSTVITSTMGTLTVIAAPVQSYPSTILADNPIGYWRLDESNNGSGNNGVTAHDNRGGHNGYYSNSVNAVAGYSTFDSDTAADFGNFAPLNSYVANINDVDFARATNAPPAAFSVEAWVFGTSLQATNSGIVSKGYGGILNVGTGTGTEQFSLDLGSGGPPTNYRFLVRNTAGQGYVAQSSVTPDTNLWHHLVGVCDQANGQLKLYIDGLLAATGPMGTGTNGGIESQPLAMTIGARQTSGGTIFDEEWVGHVDEVAVYNSALTANQASNHFFAAPRPPIITLQPINTTTNESVNVHFTSSGYGPGTVGFQWYNSDGTAPTTPIAGQNSSNLTFNTSVAQNGNNYQVLATNQYGASTSAVAQLTVVGGAPVFTPSPPFADLPSFQTVLEGHVIQLRVIPGGTAPFTYQWQKGGVNTSDNYRISGSLSSTLTIACADVSDTGNYQCNVGNGAGSAGSTIDVVTVINPGFSFTGFNSARNGWQFQSTGTGAANCGMGNNVVTNTSNAGGTQSSEFLSNQVSVARFTASFVYWDVTGAGGADGITFCLQNDTRGVTALGGGGGQLGYSSITPSWALAMNIYQPQTRGINFFQNGIVTTPFQPILPVGLGDNANPIQVNLLYDGTTMAVTFKDTVNTANTFSTSTTVDLASVLGSGAAYVGFTGADGGVAATQVISNFVFSPFFPASLKSQRTGPNTVVLSWPASSAACLQFTTSLVPPVVWTTDTSTNRIVGTDVQATITPLSGNKYFRLIVFP